MTYLVIGESVADIVRAPGVPDVAHPGGSPANVAYGLARLGHDVALLTQLGDDAMGGLIRARLVAAGVRLLDDGQSDVRTPTAVVSLDTEGRASYTFDIAWTLRPVTPRAEEVRHVHLGSIGAAAAPGAAAALAIAEALRGRATVSYDPNVRPALMGERSAALAQAERCVAAADVVKASDEDLAWLCPGEPEAAVTRRWLGMGVALVLVTRGAAGAAAYTAAHTVTAPAAAVTVVDTVGAGDAFMAAVLDALDSLHALAPEHERTERDARRERLARLTAPELTELLRRATAAAAVTVSRAGANPPDAAELRRALQAPVRTPLQAAVQAQVQAP
ncbi:PfkB family carbohydrate kinase [Streptacidiphilus neutrinimicus]|uniref:PfkB family carbohydrate kinase n=1 Tax=Streptacidiphilus neutrinimicus TaxID=105420 RepID=UPI0005A8AEE1|nr:PfkB family carbohydrate kinase [Streptacidiphilus neutrinimicus]